MRAERPSPGAALKAEEGVEEAAVFGTRIHAALAPGYGLDRLSELLRRAGAEAFRLEEAVPSLEDAFLKIVSSGSEGGGK